MKFANVTSHGRRRRLALAIGVAIVPAVPAAALATGALHGTSYEAASPSSGVTSSGHHRVHLYGGGRIVLKVTRDGRSVSVRFTSSFPILYCRTQQSLQVQKTKAASISRSGSFSALVVERFSAGPGAPGIEQVVTGHFSGSTVHGAIHTKAGDCSGSTPFSASAH